MKQRTKRDLGILLGAIAIIGITALANTQLRRTDLAKKFEEMRKLVETAQAAENPNFLLWDHLRDTKGKLRKGGNFSDELKKFDGKRVGMYGFQVPAEDYRDVNDFLLLPIPLECYYCNMPPERDVLYVQLEPGLTTPIFNEPVLLEGDFTLNQGPDQKFFYELKNTTLVKMEGNELTNKRINIQHMLGGDEHPGDKQDTMLPPSNNRYTETSNK